MKLLVCRIKQAIIPAHHPELIRVIAGAAASPVPWQHRTLERCEFVRIGLLRLLMKCLLISNYLKCIVSFWSSKFFQSLSLTVATRRPFFCKIRRLAKNKHRQKPFVYLHCYFERNPPLTFWRQRWAKHSVRASCSISSKLGTTGQRLFPVSILQWNISIQGQLQCDLDQANRECCLLNWQSSQLHVIGFNLWVILLWKSLSLFQ